MPEFKAGRAYIEVAPSLKGFRRSTEADLNKELAGAGEKAGHQLGENIGKSAEQAVRGSGRKSADQFAGEFDKQVRTRITAALKALPDAKINADSTDAQKKIAGLRADLIKLSDKKIGIDVDASQATAEIDRIRQEMAAIDGSTLNIDAKVDTAAAIAELDRLKATTDKVDGTNVQIKADADTAAAQAKLQKLQATGGGKVTLNVDADTGGAHAALTALQAHAAATAVSISSIGLAVGVLGPALIPLTAGAVGVIAGLGGAAVGAAGGLGVLGAALAPVVGAVKALGEADKNSAKDSAAASKAREAAAATAKAAGQRVQDAARAVGDAEASSARRVSDAQERVSQVREQGAQRVQAAVRAVGDAERSLADAQRSSLDAQRAINGAREDARRTLQDLALDLSGAKLRERSATLAIQDAQDALKKTNADPKATDRDRKKAGLALDEAKQSLTEIQVRTKRLSAEKATADKKGVEGSDAVVGAQKKAADAAGNVRTAERALSDARTAASKAQTQAAADNAKAARDVSRAQVDGARQVAAAQLSLTRAQEALTQATKATGDVGSESARKLGAAFKNLTPAGAGFARYIYSLKDGLVDLSKIAQNGFLPGLQDGLQSMSGYAGLLKDTLGKLSTVLGTLARDAGKALTGPFWDGFIRFLAAKAPGWLDTLGRTLGYAATGLAGLFQALGPVVDLVGEATMNALERFADWATNLGTNKGFQQFLQYIKDNGPKAAAFIGAFASAVTTVVIALAPFGTGVLDALTKGLNWLAQQDPQRIRDVATSVLVFAGTLKAAAIAQGLLNIALRANPIGILVTALAAGVAALVYFYNNNVDFRDKVNAIWKSITDAFNRVVSFIRQFWHDNGEAMRREWGRIWEQIKTTFSSVLKSIQDIVVSVAGWIQTFWREWGGRLTAFFRALWQNVKQVFSGALEVIRGVFEVFAGLFTGDWGRLWNGLKGIFSGSWKILKGTIGAAVGALKLALSLAWTAIKTVAGKAWNGIVDGIGAIFNGMKDAIKGPIYRVMQFIQENLIDKINGLFSLLKLSFRIDPIWTENKQAMAFSNGAGSSASVDRKDGGMLPGYTPGRDVHRFYSPTGGILNLSGGEPVLRPEAGMVLGTRWVDGINAAARGGGARAVKRFLGGREQSHLAGGYVWPVPGHRPNFPWGRYPSGGVHRAYDIATPVGTPVHNPYSGTIIRDGWDTTGYGNHVRIKHDNGRGYSILGHMTREIVNVGQQLAQNAIVGYSGSTGRSSGPHVHWATRRSPYSDASAFDPAKTFGVDKGAGGGVVEAIRASLASLITGGISGVVGLASSGLKNFGFFGDLLAGVVGKIGTGAANLGVRLLGLDGGGANVAAEHEPVKPLLFDSGGYLPTGLSLVSNRTGAPEPLRRVDGEGGGTRVFNLHGPGWDGEAIVAASDKVDSRKRALERSYG